VSSELLMSAFGFTNPHDILGTMFRFEWSWLGKVNYILGTVQGIDVGVDELWVTVSNKTFGSIPLSFLHFKEEVWNAEVAVSSQVPRWGTQFKGAFSLLR